MTLGRRWPLAAMAAAALGAAGGMAYAAIPDAGGVIHSCYTKSSGAWRVIDTGLGQTCKSNEAALDLYSKGGADALFLDQAEGDARYLGKTAKAADSDTLDGKDSTDFLGATATAADSSSLGGLPARAYVIGGGVLSYDVANVADGSDWSFSCCALGDQTPRIDFDLTCDTAGGTTLVVSSLGSFRWWWDESFGDAALVGSKYEAEFAIGNGVARHTLRSIMSANATTIDLDSSINEDCLFAWTVFKSANQSPGP